MQAGYSYGLGTARIRACDASFTCRNRHDETRDFSFGSRHQVRASETQESRRRTQDRFYNLSKNDTMNPKNKSIKAALSAARVSKPLSVQPH